MPVPHEDVTRELAEHLRPVFASSPDGVYLWLDEQNWMCNQRFGVPASRPAREASGSTARPDPRLISHDAGSEIFAVTPPPGVGSSHI
jgi:hypothetical protein